MFEKSKYELIKRKVYIKWEWALFFQLNEESAIDNDKWCITTFEKKPTEEQIIKAIYIFERGVEIAIRYFRKPNVNFPVKPNIKIIDEKK